ncbi:MAG: RluA family pseudouridine synthase [Candidatus Omnitrophica bacterium]|nr:RluA family pseudouridine synthase [Candidatus Omnitrophota bacterium]
MEKKKFKITSESAGGRIDQYLVEVLDKRCSRSAIQKLINEKLILLDSNPVKSRHILKEGESIAISFMPEEDSLPRAEKIELDVVYEDGCLAVINKSAGIIVHPSSISMKHTLINALLYRFPRLSSVAGDLKPGIVHRLDKDTSGLMVIAKDNDTHNELVRQFKEREVKRGYMVLVFGEVQLDGGLINAPIGRSSRVRQKMMVDYNSKRDAVTIYKVIKRFKGATLLELDLRTGRTHQIRVHLKHIGYPILGDRKYGVIKGAPRQMLHSTKLGFTHPATKKYVEFEVELPTDMQNYLSKA